MASSYHSKLRSTQKNGVTFLLFETWTLVSFPHASVQPEIFQGRGRFVEIGHFDKHLVKNTRKKGTRKKMSELIYC